MRKQFTPRRREAIENLRICKEAQKIDLSENLILFDLALFLHVEKWAHVPKFNSFKQFLPKNRGFLAITFKQLYLSVSNFAPRWEMICTFMQNILILRSLCHKLWRHKYFRISLLLLFEHGLRHEGKELIQIWQPF